MTDANKEERDARRQHLLDVLTGQATHLDMEELEAARMCVSYLYERVVSASDVRRMCEGKAT